VTSAEKDADAMFEVCAAVTGFLLIFKLWGFHTFSWFAVFAPLLIGVTIVAAEALTRGTVRRLDA
jgi:acyl-coenzyme A synthetase/AMP-(fatty) acid ligase